LTVPHHHALQALEATWRTPTRMLLHADQQSAARWWRTGSGQTQILLCARGWGKTWFMLTLALERGFLARRPERLVYAAPSREQAKQIVVPTLREMLRDCPEALAPRWSATGHSLRFTGGTELVIEGANDEAGEHLRGPFAHEVYCDEVRSWREAKTVVDSVLKPIAMRVGGRILIATTPPDSVHHDFVAMLNESRAKGHAMTRTIYDNPRLSPADIAEQISEMGGADSTTVRRELLCEIVTETERAVLPEFSVVRHVESLERPTYYDGYVSIDLGMHDFTHALFAYYDKPTERIVIERELCVQSKPVSEIAPLVSAIELELWGTQRPRVRVSDNHPMEIAEFGRQHLLQPDRVGRPLSFAPANNQKPEALLNRVRSLLFKDRLKIHPSCAQLITQCEGGLWNARRTDFDRTRLSSASVFWLFAGAKLRGRPTRSGCNKCWRPNSAISIGWLSLTRTLGRCVPQSSSSMADTSGAISDTGLLCTHSSRSMTIRSVGLS